MKVLHITYWYPNKDQPQAGLFIKNHIDGLDNHCTNERIHIQVLPSKSWLKKEKSEHAILYKTRFWKYYKSQEILTFRAIKKLLKSHKKSNFDLINFHIATPLAIRIKALQKITSIPIVITEHWTAYYRNFGLNKDHKGLEKIKNIFYEKIGLITVSKALGEDIKKFSGNQNLKYDVVPNIIDTDLFHYKEVEKKSLRFFMLTNWSPEKKPLILLKALAEYPLDFELNIGGDGILLDDMKSFVKQHGLSNKVNFLGRISPAEAAEQFKNSSYFLHAAEYETFSVVCAEALCCGCPVIATNIPAIIEYMNSRAGILVKGFEEKNKGLVTESWKSALSQITENEYDRAKISSYFSERFGKQKVGELYFNTLKKYAQK